jgi:hypothetical protein
MAAKVAVVEQAMMTKPILSARLTWEELDVDG